MQMVSSDAFLLKMLDCSDYNYRPCNAKSSYVFIF